MEWGQLVDSFFSSDSLKIVLILVVVDFVLGVLAAVRMGTFALSKVSGFLKDDVALKVFPYFILWTGGEVAGGVDLVIPGLDMSLISDGVFAVLTGAMVGSIFSSISDLGFGFGRGDAQPAQPAQPRNVVAFLTRGEHS